MTGSWTRRGFLGLSAAALAGGDRRLHRGHGPRQRQQRGADPASNNLRLFTYEDDTTIGLLKDRGRRSSTARTARPRASTACRGPARRSTRTSCARSCSAAPVPTSGASGAARSAPRSPRRSRPWTSRPYYQKYGWDSKINTNAIAGMTFNGMKAGVPIVVAAIGAWYSKAAIEKAGIAAHPDELRRARGGERQARRLRHHPGHARRQVRLGHHAPVRVPARGLGRPGPARQAAQRRRRAGTAPRWSTRSRTSRSGRTRSGCRTAPSASTRATSSPTTSRARPPTRSPAPGPRRRRIQAGEEELERLRHVPAADRPDPERATPVSSRAT